MGPEREQVERTIAAVVAAEPGLPQETRDAATRSLKTLISGCLESDLFREILGSKERRTEYSLSMIHNGDVLNGTIDCLYRSTGGRWALVDYKSDTLAKTDITRRAESYRSQIGFYAFLVSHYFQQESVDCTLLFLRHPGEPVRYSFGADELAQVGSMIESFAGALRRGEFKRNSRLCSHCTYRKGSDCLIPFHGQ
jgi:ATP-dependent exoDNAse (exonuclease V) beta subunit